MIFDEIILDDLDEELDGLPNPSPPHLIRMGFLLLEDIQYLHLINTM